MWHYSSTGQMCFSAGYQTRIPTASLAGGPPAASTAPKAMPGHSASGLYRENTVPIFHAGLKLSQPLNGNGLFTQDRKSTRLNSSHLGISYAVFCLKKKKKNI